MVEQATQVGRQRVYRPSEQADDLRFHGLAKMAHVESRARYPSAVELELAAEEVHGGHPLPDEVAPNDEPRLQRLALRLFRWTLGTSEVPILPASAMPLASLASVLLRRALRNLLSLRVSKRSTK